MYCTVCEQELPESAFGTRRLRSGQIVPRLPCKVCDAQRKHDRWERLHPPKEHPPKDPDKRAIEARRREKRSLRLEGKKRCVACGEIKFLENFGAGRAVCQPCCIEKIRQRNGYYERQALKKEKVPPSPSALSLRLQQNRELAKEGKKWCPHCAQALPLEQFYKNPKTGRRLSWCRSCSRIACRATPRKKVQTKPSVCRQCGAPVPKGRMKCDACKAPAQERRRRNKNRRKAARQCERRATDPQFRLKRRISETLRDILHEKKSGSMTKWTGCSKAFLIEWLEKQFAEGMSWENYGEWHIDHIIPQSYFDYSDEEQVRICWNYRNLRPLWGGENIAKGDSLPDGYLNLLEEIKVALRA